jgi:hypothetical protein
MVSWEAELELYLDLHQGRDLIKHSQYCPAFILLGIKDLAATYSRLFLVWANLCPHSNPFSSSFPVNFGHSSPKSWPFLFPVFLSPFPLHQLSTSPEDPPLQA